MLFVLPENMTLCWKEGRMYYKRPLNMSNIPIGSKFLKEEWVDIPVLRPKRVLSGIWKEDPIAEWVRVKDLLQNKDTRG